MPVKHAGVAVVNAIALALAHNVRRQNLAEDPQGSVSNFRRGIPLESHYKTERPTLSQSSRDDHEHLEAPRGLHKRETPCQLGRWPLPCPGHDDCSHVSQTQPRCAPDDPDRLAEQANTFLQTYGRKRRMTWAEAEAENQHTSTLPVTFTRYCWSCNRTPNNMA